MVLGSHRSLLLAIALAVFTFSPAAARKAFVDDAGRSVDLPDRIEKVMAAGPPASVLLYMLAPAKMAGWVSAPAEEQKPFLAGPVRDLPAYGRITGKGGTANVEGILALKPDLIIDVGSVNETYASLADRIQAQTGVPYILIDGRFKNSAETLRKVGRTIGETERAEVLARYVENAMTRLDKEVGAVPVEKRPRVYYARGPNGLETGLAGSINMEVLDAVGAVNVAKSAGSGGLANVSIEQVLAWNPDVVITQDQGFQGTIKTDPQWQSLSAVRNGRVYRAPTLPFGWFDSPPGVNRVMSVFWLSAVLYPEYSKVDLKRETREFYKLFYQVDLTGEQVDTLLSGVQGGR